MLTDVQKARLSSLNQGNARGADLTTLLDRAPKVVAVEWDFAVQGGANATDIDLDYTFEEDAIVYKILFQELTNVVGVNSTYTLEAGSTAISEAVAVASLAGITQPAFAGSAAAIAVTAGSKLQLNIGTADASAGKLRFYVFMIPNSVV